METVVASGQAGEICEPQGKTVLLKITACLSVGMEAVLVSDGAGVVCAAPSKGGTYLEIATKPDSQEKRYLRPSMIASDVACEFERRKSGADKRLLGRGFVKELIRESVEKIQPIGIRIIGGIYCEGLDLTGLDIPFSLVLDRSIFRGENNGRVDIRNFRTKGDFALDNAVVYTTLLIIRAEISGSIWGTSAFIQKIQIANTTVKGSIRLEHSIIPNRLIVENVSVTGDVNIASSLFSNLEIVRDKIGGALDISQSQARCTYDIRKNEIGDIVAAQLGFGVVESSGNNAAETYGFKSVKDDPKFGRPLPPEIDDPYDIFAARDSSTSVIIWAANECPTPRSIKPGTFVLVDNHLNSSLCLRSFNWLTDQEGRPRESNIYFNENVIAGATWLDVTGPLQSTRSEERFLNSREPKLSIFNVRTGTLILNFDLTKQNVRLEVNGLHFERVYTSNGVCESALSLRVGAPKKGPSDPEITFPPVLRLPRTDQIIDWINKNKFARTQQPFAEFVAVFERAGDPEAAKELKIRAATAAVESSLCSLFPSSWVETAGLCAVKSNLDEGPASKSSMIEEGTRWVEKAVVAMFNLMLWVLADHGYRPERIGWFVGGTIVIFMAIFVFWLRVVAYSLESNPDIIKPIGFVFLFDKLLPAYKIREGNYENLRFYVIPKKLSDRKTILVRSFFKEWRVAEATNQENERVERSLNILRFLGLLYTIFIIAAIGGLVH